MSDSSESNMETILNKYDKIKKVDEISEAEEIKETVMPLRRKYKLINNIKHLKNIFIEKVQFMLLHKIFQVQNLNKKFQNYKNK